MTYGFWSLFSNHYGWGEDDRNRDDDRKGDRNDKDDHRDGGGKDDRKGGRDHHDKDGRWDKDKGGKDDCDDCYSVKIEAEDMSRWNYGVEWNGDASGDKVAKLCGDYGKLWTDFSGPSGKYDLKLNVIDENDGKGWFKVYVDGELVKTVRLDQQVGDHSDGFATITLEGIDLSRGDQIKIYGYADGGEYARIDSIEIDSCEPEAPNAPPTFTNAGDACVDVAVDENSTAVYDLDATDPDGDALTYAITGGEDAHLFVIDPATGEISFKEGPDYEAPASRDGDNVYKLEVTATDPEGAKDVACLKVEVKDVDDTPRPGDDCTFTLSYCGLDVAITLTELSDGSVRFDVEVPEGSQKIGDLRGLFFHLSDESKIGSLSVSGDDVTDAQFREDRVSDLGNGANVNGLGRFDAGVEFGTSGLRDDIRETSFTLTADGGLTLDDFRFQDFAVRLTSVGWEGGWRRDSVKMEGNAGPLECDCACETCAEGFTKLTFDDLARGTAVTDQYADLGVIITAEKSNGAGDAAMIFDSSNPTGGDWDLRTEKQGALLIISEDGDASDPDDNAHGGKITFTFPTLATLDEILVVDVEESGGTIILYDILGFEISTISIPAGANGSIRSIDLGGAEGVARMEVNFKGSGAVDDLCFKPGEGGGSETAASISGELWCDKGEHDGQDLEVDNGVGGRTVTLFAEDGTEIAQTTTAEDGTYTFGDLIGGSYYVTFGAQGFTQRNVGDDATDSDVDPLTGATVVFEVAEGEVVQDVDAGLICFDANEEGLLGIIDAIDTTSQEFFVLDNDKNVGTSYDAGTQTLTVNTALFGILPSAEIIPSTRMELSIQVDESGDLVDDAGGPDMFIWVDSDGDYSRDPGEDVLLEANVFKFGYASGAPGPNFNMDFAMQVTGGDPGYSYVEKFPDLLGLLVNAEFAGASDFSEDFATPNVKSLAFGNLAYDCIC